MPTILPPTLLSLDPSLHDPHITVESTSCSTEAERDKGDDTFHTFCVLNKYEMHPVLRSYLRSSCCIEEKRKIQETDKRTNKE